MQDSGLYLATDNGIVFRYGITEDAAGGVVADILNPLQVQASKSGNSEIWQGINSHIRKGSAHGAHTLFKKEINFIVGVGR